MIEQELDSWHVKDLHDYTTFKTLLKKQFQAWMENLYVYEYERIFWKEIIQLFFLRATSDLAMWSPYLPYICLKQSIWVQT